MGNILTFNEHLDEVLRLYREGKSVEEAIRIVKGYSLTDQSIENNQTKKYNLSLAPNEDIDKDQVFDIKTGKTIRELCGPYD